MKSLVAAVLLAIPMFANAYTWDQTIDFTPDKPLTQFSTFTFTHDITTQGFNPGVDNISGYSLTLNIYNDKGMFDAIYIDQLGTSGDTFAVLYNWTAASVTTGASYQGVASLNSNGLLNVSVTSLLGTFYLDKSELTATGTQSSAHAVPEPTSAALLAAGLLGITVMRRKGNKAGSQPH